MKGSLEMNIRELANNGGSAIGLAAGAAILNIC